MRMLMKVQMPTESGNDAIKDGSLPQVMASSLEALRAEAAYFTAEDGMRTALIFFDMKDASDIPAGGRTVLHEPRREDHALAGHERPGDAVWRRRRQGKPCREGASGFRVLAMRSGQNSMRMTTRRNVGRPSL